MEPLGRKATKSGARGTRPQASGCVSLQVDCGLLGPQQGPWPVLYQRVGVGQPRPRGQCPPRLLFGLKLTWLQAW